MAEKITKIVEIEIDVKSGELKILDAELNKIIGKKAKLNDQQKAENETTSAAIGLIDKFTGGLASSAEGWFKMGKNAVKALTGIKSGLISTGIGALVVGLGLVVAYWDEITSFLGFANDEQEDLNKQTDLYNAKLRTTAENLNTLSATNKKRILDEAEANGEAIDDLEVQIRYLQELSDAELKKLSEAEKAYEKRAVAAKGFFESEESYLERTKQEFERRSKVEQEISDIEEKRLTLFEQIRKLKQQQSDEVLDQIKKEDDVRTAAQEKANALLQKYLDLKLTLEQAHSLALIEDDRQRQLKAIEFELENNKRSIENSEFTEKQKAALSELYYTQWLDKKTQLSDTWSAEDEAKRIVEEQKAIARDEASKLAAFKRQKALGIASAIISTSEAAINAFKSTVGIPVVGPVLAPIAAAAAIAAGVAQVQNIRKQEYNGGSSSAPSISPSGGTGALSQAPQFNTVGTSGFNQLSDSIAGQNNRPVQAYVVANDVSSAQSLDRNRVRQASFP
jgi:hypothetical protein